MATYNRREILALGSALALAGGSAHSAEKWIEGKHYFRIEKPQPPPRPGAITVTEIFSYGCPACNRFLPSMQSLEKKLASTVMVDYLHASWLPAENWPTLQRAHITAKALGVAKNSHAAMFAAVWNTGELAITDSRTGRLRSPLPSLQDMAKFYQRVAGVPAAKFLETARSFSVETEIRRTDAMINTLKADGTPTLIVNGKYRIEPHTAGGDQVATDIALFLAR